MANFRRKNTSSQRHAGQPDGQQQLLTALGLTPEANPLAPARRARRTFEETVQLLELFLHR
ncbi:hypothetical protein ACF06P_08985 [Streptomyces sp. NPDC015684]|uniref:hypothetical protein n=1 Tax=Streptomyces sp. NPDC015684 TaxID=3364963 RepID=UPI0036FC51E5